MIDLTDLKRVTAELALEIEDEDRGPWFDFFTFFFDQLDVPVSIVSANLKLVWINGFGKRLVEGIGCEVKLGEDCFLTFYGAQDACQGCHCVHALNSRKVITEDRFSQRFRQMFRVTSIPLLKNGGSAVVVISLPLESVSGLPLAENCSVER